MRPAIYFASRGLGTFATGSAVTMAASLGKTDTTRANT